MRGFWFALIALWMFVGPIVTQGFGKFVPVFAAWHMFRLRALDLVEVELARREPDGRLVPIDRMQVLGQGDRRKIPPARQRIVGEDGLDKAVRELCARLPRGTDLRVKARIAERAGWRTLRVGDVNACEGRK
jgi:hypothetical protein